MLIKNKKGVKVLCLVAAISATLFACSDEEHMQDLHNYILSLKKTITRHKRANILADIHFPVPITFQDQKHRDPFGSSEVTVGGQQESSNPLLAFPVKSYQYIGTIVRDKQDWAVIRAPDNKVYQVTINNRFGNHYGRIIKVSADQLEVEELVGTPESGGQGKEKQIVTLQLKGGSE